MLLDMDDKLTGMWSALKQSNKLPADSLLMGNCETELQELMKQVDIMMHNKCMDWDKERQHLQVHQIYQLQHIDYHNHNYHYFKKVKCIIYKKILW